MKLSKAIRESMAFLSIDHDISADTEKFSCNCLLKLGTGHYVYYKAMIMEYGFTPEYINILLDEHRELFPEKQQEFRIHMMELMACIAEDEGN